MFAVVIAVVIVVVVVVLILVFIDKELALYSRQNDLAGAGAFDEVAIVRNHDDSAGELGEG